VAVVVRAKHLCMTTRGVHKPGVAMTTSSMRGVFRDIPEARAEVLTLMGVG
jgi:GTP cyclohydrolase I